jgi:demethylmenaquinone methyltransferase/2-methoxy-6-polyprenyl-1,4-benzoquinol methylase
VARRFCAPPRGKSNRFRRLPRKKRRAALRERGECDRLECVSSHPAVRDMADEHSTDFGFQRVARTDKARRVRAVFDSVADNYDLMNDLMSAGAHRLWKRFTLGLANLRPGQRALDVAGGSGDLAAGLARQVGERGLVVLSDINAAMLARGRDRLIDAGCAGNVATVQANAERLPFADGSFDCITIGFGLRNVTDKAAALSAMHRALKPGGQLLVLEFSQPRAPGLKRLYDAYSFRLLPWLGRVVAHDEASYRYLAESIRMHPDADTLLGMLQAAGLEGCRYHLLSGGIVAVHRGYKC